VNESLREVCVRVCAARDLQPEEMFVTKVLQYDEILQVRHSVSHRASKHLKKTHSLEDGGPGSGWREEFYSLSFEEVL
jgi:hypothetical protein